MSEQSHKDVTQLTDEELDERIKAAKDKRKETTQKVEAAAIRKRKENELILADIEAETGKTLGVDLGAIFTEHGDMIVVQRPPMVVFEKFAFKNLNAPGAGLALDSQSVDDLLADPTVLYPKTSGEREAVYTKTRGSARITAALLVQKMCDQNQAVFEGKS